MTTWKVLLVACAWTGTAVAQVQPFALPTNPKPLTTPNPFDGGVSVIPSGTGFLLGWNSGPNFQNNGTAVFARLFSSTGVGLQPVVTLRKSTPNLVGRPKFADLLGGKFAVVWQNHQQTFNGVDFIEGGIFNTATNTIGAIKTLALPNSPVHDIIRMTTGNLALLTQKQSNTGKAQIVVTTFNGTTFAKLKGPVVVNGAGDTDIGQSFDHTIVGRQAGGYAIYRNRDANPNVLLMRGFNQDAVLDSKAIRVNSTPFLIGISGNDLLKFSVRAARLTNNNIVVTWAQYENTANSYEIRARLFTNAGTPVGKDFRVNTALPNDQYWPKPIPLLNGTFAIAWLSDQAPNGQWHYLRVYKADGTPAHLPVITQKVTFPSSVTIDNALARLADGSLVDAFHDSNFNNERILGDGIPKTQAQAPTVAAEPIDIGDLH